MRDDRRRRERSLTPPSEADTAEWREKQRMLARALQKNERSKTDLKSRQERMEQSSFSKPQSTKKFEDKSVKKAKEKIKRKTDSETESISEMRRKRRLRKRPNARKIATHFVHMKRRTFADIHVIDQTITNQQIADVKNIFTSKGISMSLPNQSQPGKQNQVSKFP